MDTNLLAAQQPDYPYRHLLQSRRIEDLWTMRLLMRLGALHPCVEKGSERDLAAVAERLRIPVARSDESEKLKLIAARLRATYPLMERQRKRYIFGAVLSGNLRLLREHLRLTETEEKLLALAILMRTHDSLNHIADRSWSSINVVWQVAQVTGPPITAVTRALARSSLLFRSGLLQIHSGNSVNANMSLARASLRRLATQRCRNLEQLLTGFLRPAPSTGLSMSEYGHVTPAPQAMVTLLTQALKSKRTGVNILLYGEPGTGKTQLARLLAKASGAPLYEVSPVDEDGLPLSPRDRLVGASVAQLALSRKPAVLVFDEIDAIFGDGSSFFGRPTTAETAKSWVNDLLEENRVPAIWIANQVRRMDPAFLRRFELVLRIDSPPARTREALLVRHAGGFLAIDEIARIAAVDDATPAVLVQAAQMANRVGRSRIDKVRLMEKAIDGVLIAQGKSSIRRASAHAVTDGFDVRFANADTDLQALRDALVRAPSGRVCLYGPPGTGKTAFGKWVARETGRPLLIKRVSDIQSPWIGEMEQNLAKLFEEASNQQSVLQIDEVDSFLRDRRQARASWEVSQVNEFLTQLEMFDGIFIGTTNLLDELDPAVMRRFDHKIRMDFLAPAQVVDLLITTGREFGWEPCAVEGMGRQVSGLNQLTPGDFAVVRRRHMSTPFQTMQDLVSGLRREQSLKAPQSARIGFL